MSDTPDNTLQTDELTAQVDELLEEIDRQADAVESRMRDGNERSAEIEGILTDTGVHTQGGPAREAETNARKVPEDTSETDGETGVSETMAETGGEDEVVEQLLEQAATLAPKQASTTPDAMAAELTAADVSDPEPAEATADEPSADLDADVDALLQQAEAGDENSARPENDAEPSASESVLDDDIEALIESVAADSIEVEGDAQEATLSETTSGAGVDEDAGKGVEPTRASDDDSAPSAEELDEELAAEAEDAIEHQIEGEIETVDLGAVVEQEAFGDESEVPVPKVAVEQVPAVSEPEPVSERAAAVEVAPATDSRTANPVGGVLRVCESLLAVLSRPLAGLTPRQRDTIGWVALNVLFIAVCVWLVVLMR